MEGVFLWLAFCTTPVYSLPITLRTLGFWGTNGPHTAFAVTAPFEARF